MNDVLHGHPSRDQLAAFGLGQLEEAQAVALESHLGACPECCAVLEGLPEDLFVAKLRSSARPDAGPTRSGNLASPEAPTLTNPLPAEAVPPELPPELADHPRYRIVAVLGVGGMGVVYKAEHQLMERPVALKVINRNLTKDPAAVERFRREVRSAARLAHPNIVTAYDAEQAGETHFLVMEFVEGTPLDRLVADQGPLSVAVACDYVRQAAQGLQHAFERGMVHRDIKPGNLMRTPGGVIKILDFGLALFAQEAKRPSVVTPTVGGGPAPERAAADTAAASLTQNGTVMGTPDYMAPEQAVNAHQADIRADIYSLGCTLYYLLAGQVPFPAATVFDKLMAHVERSPRPVTEVRPDVPAALGQVLGKMLAKDPAQRYATPAEAAQALEPFTDPAAVAAALREQAEAGPAAATPPRRPRRRVLALAGGLGGAALLTGLVLFLQMGQEKTVTEEMEIVYTVCAVVSGTLLLCQFLLGLLGATGHSDGSAHDFHVGDAHDVHAGEGHDADHDAQTSWFAGVLTLRALVAALTLFGLAGRTADAGGFPPLETFVLALAAAAATLLLVAWLMRSLYRLRSDGTVRIHRAVGQSGTVYLPVPANRAGLGKVLLNLQNRTMEYQAVTGQGPLPTGAKVTVVAVVSSDTVEVVPAP
jgi:hypothetical protein